MVTTLRAHAVLIENLLKEAYHYVITARLQSNPVLNDVFPSAGKAFLLCGSFLVNLREVRNCERILQCRFLLKENINFWEEDLTSKNQECVTVTEDIFGSGTSEIVESVLDENNVEVTTWYVAKKFIKRSKCESYKILLKLGDNDIAHDA